MGAAIEDDVVAARQDLAGGDFLERGSQMRGEAAHRSAFLHISSQHTEREQDRHQWPDGHRIMIRRVAVLTRRS